MPYKTSKYTTTQNGEFTTRCIDVLENSPEAMSIADIQKSDMVLHDVTSQKLSRILNHLVEFGVIKKTKDRASGHMVYKSIKVMAEQGYEV